MIKVVSFNGGRGAKNLIPTLLKKEGVDLSCIVNAYDDGKSTGELRNFFSMLGPSDIRKVQEAMVPLDHPDYESILKAYDFRYPVGSTKEDVFNDINNFINGRNTVASIEFTDKNLIDSLRVVLQKFTEGVELIEKAEQKQLNFSDCSLTNIIYAGCFLYFGGNFEDSTFFIDKLFKLKGTVLPTNNEDKKLVAIREDGTILYSEAEIVELRSNSRIKKIYLLDRYPARESLEKMSIDEVENYFELMSRQVAANPKAIDAIREADIIIYSAGTQHSSLYPSYMTKGITDAIVGNKSAVKVLITNIGEDYETPSYTATDYVAGTLRYLKMGSHSAVENKDLITHAFVNQKFSKNLENYVKFDKAELDDFGFNIVLDDFDSESAPGKHNGEMVAKMVLELYENNLSLKNKKK